MDLWTTIFAIFRRWYITVPVVIVAVVASFGIAGGIKPSYELSGSILISPPAPYDPDGDGITEQPVNPLVLNGGVQTAVRAAFNRLDGALVREQFDAEGRSPVYDLITDRDAAFLNYTITADSPEQAQDTADALRDETDAHLQEIQVGASVEPHFYVTVTETQRSSPEVIDGGKVRTQATIIILGIVAAAAGALLVDGIAARRKGLANNQPIPAAYHPTYPMPMPGPYGYQQPMPGQPMPPQMGPMGPVGQVGPGAVVPPQPGDGGYANGSNGNGNGAPARPEPEPTPAYDDHSLDALLDDEPGPEPAPTRHGNGARAERPTREPVEPDHDDYDEIDVREAPEEPRRRPAAESSDRRRRAGAERDDRRDDDRGDEDRVRREPRPRSARPTNGVDPRERTPAPRGGNEARTDGRNEDEVDGAPDRNGARQGTRPVNRRPAPATRKTRTARSMPSKGGRPEPGQAAGGQAKRATPRNARRNDDGGTAESAAANRSSTSSADRGVEDHDG